MTIPIQPGPFSFIAELGKAGGAAFASAEEARQRKLQEAQEKARSIVALRAAGLLNPKQFDSPEIQEIFKMAGFGPVSGAMTSGETLEYGKREALPGVLGSQNPDERNALLGLPQRGLTQKIDAEIAGSQAAVPKAQLEGAAASAQLPDVGATALSGQQGAQDKTFNEIADRVVESLYAKTKKLPTAAEAYEVGQTDERGKVFGPRISEPYYGSAIERLRAKLADEATKRLGADARARGAAGTGLDDLLGIHQNQQTRITAELNALEAPESRDLTMADLAKQLRAKGKPVSPIIAGAEERVARYQRRRSELEQQMQQTREQLDRMLGGSLETPGATPPGTTGSPQKRAAASEYERRVKGVTDPAKRKQIADEIARKYNIAPQSNRRF